MDELAIAGNAEIRDDEFLLCLDEHIESDLAMRNRDWGASAVRIGLMVVGVAFWREGK